MKNILLSTILVLCVSGSLPAQLAGYVFGIDNPSANVFWFSKTDVASGVHTQLFQMPIVVYSSASSSCVDPVQQLYIYSSGTEIYKIDPVSGTLISTVQLSLPGNANLYHVQYNPCDSMIYGVVNNYPTSIYFARYNPYTDVLTNAGNLPLTTMFCMGCMAAIDPVNQQYIMHDGSSLNVIDIATGQLLYTTPIVNLNSEIFGHISYDCASGKIIGTSASQSESVKFLASVDPLTGIVTHTSGFHWPQGWWKPSGGGNCIDYSTGTYYYSGAPDLLIGVNIATGDTTGVHATGQGSFLFVQCFSICPCAPNDVPETAASSLSVYPNPASDVLIVECDAADQNGYFVITDAAGREVLHTTLNGLRNVISIGHLAEGVYFWRNEGDGSQGRFVRAKP